MGTSIPSSITAVQDRLVLTVGDVKRLLRIPEGDIDDDDLIKLAISAGKAAADQFMQNPFYAMRADLTADDAVNWTGNLQGRSAQSDIITNNPLSADIRLSHNIPSLYDDPPAVEAIPDMVKLGVVKYVEMVMDSPPNGVASEKIGDWTIAYIQGQAQGDLTANIQETYWASFELTRF